ncbi:MAG: TolC family protein [Proteobacteria bacterium]|nr:TolC family protein [Pseudomonadota bacterium]
MKKFLIVIVMVLLPFWGSAQERKIINIGIVYDGKIEDSRPFIGRIRNEMVKLVGAKYDIRVPEDMVFHAGWSADKVEKTYRRLADDERVHIILAGGILTASVVARLKNHPKPAIVLGIFDLELQGIPLTRKNTSGVRNLTYVYSPRSIKKELDLFHRVFPFKRAGLVFYEELGALSAVDSYRLLSERLKDTASVRILPMTSGFDPSFQSSMNDIDALFVGYLGRFEQADKTQLIQYANKKRLATFGVSPGDVQRGMLAASAPEQNIPRILRRIALNVESILDGEDPANLPVFITFEEKLVVNMATARAIDWSPGFSILSQAELINENEPAEVILGLTDVMKMVVKTNPDVEIERLTVRSSEKDVAMARSKFLPSLDISVSGVMIDKERAENSFGSQPERTVSGSLALEQLVFSEQALGNLSIQENALRASEFGRDRVALDLMLDAGVAYFNLLKAESLLKIRKDNLKLVEANLKIAKQREKAGYSSKSDVYRWESQYAMDMKNLIEARTRLRLARIQLNNLLHLSLDDSFDVKDVTLKDGSFAYMGHKSMVSNLDNPRSVMIMIRFLTERAVRNSPEIKQIDANTAALDRSLDSIRRQHYVPTVGLRAERQRIFSRGGEGQPVNPIDDQWNLGITLSLPLFKGGSVVHQQRQLQIDIEKLRLQRQSAVKNIETNVRRTILDLSAGAAKLHLSKRAAMFAGQSFRLIRDAYSKGMVTFVELSDAQTAALNANLTASNAVYDFFIYVLQSERAQGDFLIVKSEKEIAGFFEELNKYLKQSSGRGRRGGTDSKASEE